MGCAFSSCNNTSSSSLVCRNVRVVHLNGEVEDFDYPVSVGELTARLPKHFVCTQSQLLCPCSKPLVAETFLERGQIYFLLPFSFFQSNFSPNDLVTIARKLTTIARSNNRPKASSAIANLSGPANGNAPVCSPNWFADLEFEKDKPCKLRSWKPILATIRERSFNRRSESDLQEKGMEILERTGNSRR